MKKYSPLVSIILPVYNCEPYLNQCLDSLVEQTYENIEIIAIDDCSSDNSLERLKKINDDRLRVLSNEINKGMSATLNTAIACCSGEFIMRMDGDDFIDKTKVEKQIDFLMQNPDIDVVGCNYARVTLDGNHVHYSDNPQKSVDISKLLSLRKFFLSGPNFSITDGTLMAKASWFKRYQYDPQIFYSQDFDLISRALGNSKFANLKEPLYFYRQGSGVTANLKAQLISCLVRYRSISRIRDLSIAVRAVCYISLAIRPASYMLIYLYYKLTK